MRKTIVTGISFKPEVLEALDKMRQYKENQLGYYVSRSEVLNDIIRETYNYKFKVKK